MHMNLITRDGRVSVKYSLCSGPDQEMSRYVIIEAGQRLSQYWALEAAVTEAAWARGGRAGGLHGVMHSTQYSHCTPLHRIIITSPVSCHSIILTGDETKLKPPLTLDLLN